MLGFGPTLLLTRTVRAVSEAAARGAAGLSPLGSCGSPQANRADQEQIRMTFDVVAGFDEARAELLDGVRLPTRAWGPAGYSIRVAHRPSGERAAFDRIG